jgi:hypothetical protein
VPVRNPGVVELFKVVASALAAFTLITVLTGALFLLRALLALAGLILSLVSEYRRNGKGANRGEKACVQFGRENPQVVSPW